MTDIQQLSLFGDQMPPNCLFPNNKPMTGYRYGCRCRRCYETNLSYQRRYNKTHTPYPPCVFCGNLSVNRLYPVCFRCRTPFMKRCIAARLDWQWILEKHLRSTCGICHCALNMSAIGGPGSWQVDHDHAIARLVTPESARDVICGPCNSKLGHIEKAFAQNVFQLILDYMKRHTK